MPDNFEWQTEEDGRWEEEFAPTASPPPRRRPWRVAFTVLTVLLILLAAARWQISQQVATATTTVESEVLQAHNFLARTAQQNDVDLLKSLISGRDKQWSEAQAELVEMNWYGNPPLLGWTAVPPPLATTENVTITLSPDLRAAELQTINTYRVLNAEGITETVQLEQTAVYRLGDTRWLLAAPLADYWGNWMTQEGDHITLTYPERDEAIAQKLLADLDALVERICRDLDGLSCDGYHKQVRLEKEAISLLYHTEREASLLPGSTQYLPTPSLLGLPVDEASYQALYRAYGGQVATAVITDLVGYDCCEWVMLYLGLLDRQLHQLGLKPTPVTQADYDLIFNRLPYYRMNSLFANFLLSSELHWKHLHTFVAFLEEQAAPDVSLADMQRAMIESQTVPDWLRQITAGQLETEVLESTFLQFLFSHSRAAPTNPSSIPLPANEVQLICDGNNDYSSIYNFNLETQAWRELFRYDYDSPGWTTIRRLPHSPGSYLVTEIQGEVYSHHTLVEDGEIVATFELPLSERERSISPYDVVGGDPNGRFLLMSRWRQDDIPELALLDLAACRAGDCSLVARTRWLEWSPDGSRSLLIGYAPWQLFSALAEGQTTFFVRQRNGREEITPGVGPFWLTNDVYGYYQPGEDGELALVTAVVGEYTPRSLLTSDDLLQLIDSEQRPEQLMLETPLRTSQMPGFLLIRASDAQAEGSVAQTYFFLVELSDTLDTAVNVKLLYHSANYPVMSMSPDGRWFVINEYGSVGLNHTLLLNQESGEWRDLSDDYEYGTQWSADGNWLLVNGEDHLLLTTPEGEYSQLIFHNFDGCFQADWAE